MTLIKTGKIPEDGLLKPYAQRLGCYTDCFLVDVPRRVELFEYVSVFFNTPVFRLERKLLSVLAASPSDYKDVVDLANGASDTLAIWKVEARNETQLIMAVGEGPIRTWLMCQNNDIDSGTTRLYFGSAVLPTEQSTSEDPKLGRMFHITLGFHKLYSRILLGSTKRKLVKNHGCNHPV
jgi:hypothetical protein